MKNKEIEELNEIREIFMNNVKKLNNEITKENNKNEELNGKIQEQQEAIIGLFEELKQHLKKTLSILLI